ncbi:MAG: DUF2706 domain-containing protein [Rickettsiaceae bacterium]|nr:MAG: DUF2706 domain-containing protein [Rickettsiaceae bacterium]
MMKITNSIALLCCAVLVSSCTPNPPYEIKSPCVSSSKSSSVLPANPCIRRPANDLRRLI